MKNFTGGAVASLFVICLLTVGSATAQQLNDFTYKGSFDPLGNAISNKVQFNGYTNYWQIQ